MTYSKYNDNSFAIYANYSDFYEALLQKVQRNWNRSGNKILGLSDSKVSRLFSGKQKDAEVLILMAEFMQYRLLFNIG
jgi:hypothetical protein